MSPAKPAAHCAKEREWSEKSMAAMIVWIFFIAAILSVTNEASPFAWPNHAVHAR